MEEPDLRNAFLSKTQSSSLILNQVEGQGARPRACARPCWRRSPGVRGPVTLGAWPRTLPSLFRYGCSLCPGAPAALCGVPGRETQCLADLPARLRCITVSWSPPRSPQLGSTFFAVPQSSPGSGGACHLPQGVLFLSLRHLLEGVLFPSSSHFHPLSSFAGVLDPSIRSVVFLAVVPQPPSSGTKSMLRLQAHG